MRIALALVAACDGPAANAIWIGGRWLIRAGAVIWIDGRWR
jgi:hypothetical protein